MRQIAISTALLYTLWLLLSGHYTGLLLTLGFLSALGASLIGARMGVLDDEGLPMAILFRLPKITLWLIWEILKSNWGVVKVIINPALAKPQMVSVKASQKSVAGLVTHANFITLTPGTVSVDVDEQKNVILVHGLTDAFAEACLEPDMDKKVSSLEGKKGQA
ncbi:MAG: Na+/H+ antiporter subunit E [Alphaproteobacteria bacterium]|nr:Na+/H+ antiporter subunit E [Alphaproteobacteria bacterium]